MDLTEKEIKDLEQFIESFDNGADVVEAMGNETDALEGRGAYTRDDQERHRKVILWARDELGKILAKYGEALDKVSIDEVMKNLKIH